MKSRVNWNVVAPWPCGQIYEEYEDAKRYFEELKSKDIETRIVKVTTELVEEHKGKTTHFSIGKF